jgi:hypothetical protein
MNFYDMQRTRPPYLSWDVILDVLAHFKTKGYVWISFWYLSACYLITCSGLVCALGRKACVNSFKIMFKQVA